MDHEAPHLSLSEIERFGPASNPNSGVDFNFDFGFDFNFGLRPGMVEPPAGPLDRLAPAGRPRGGHRGRDSVVRPPAGQRFPAAFGVQNGAGG